MSTTNNPSSGGAAATSGADDEVSKLKGHVEKLTKELTNYRTEVTTLKTKLEEKDNKVLEGQNKYQELYENQKRVNEELQSKQKSTEDRIIGSRKQDAVKSSLLKLGLDEKHLDSALRLVDLKKVVVDSETETVFGAEDVAKSFYESHKGLGYFKKPGAGAPNHSAPRLGDSVETSVPDLTKMSQADKIAELRKRGSKG